MNDPIWRPTAEQIASANMTAFQRFVRERFPNQPLDRRRVHRHVKAPAI